MHLKFTKLLLTIVVLAAIAYLSNAIWQQYFVEVKPAEENQNVTLKPEAGFVANENAIFIDDQQIAGDAITVKTIALLTPGYLSVHSEDGSFIGSSTLFQAGVYRNLSLSLPGIPEGENNLSAVLFSDGGGKMAEKKFFLKKVSNKKPDPSAPYMPRDVVIDMVLTDYELIPKAIAVNLGDRVTLNINNKHVDYEIIIEKLGINLKIPAGAVTKLAFTAKEAGIFRAFCPVKCEPGGTNSRTSIEVKYK